MGIKHIADTSFRIRSSTKANHVAHKHERQLFAVEYFFAIVRVTLDFLSPN